MIGDLLNIYGQAIHMVNTPIYLIGVRSPQFSNRLFHVIFNASLLSTFHIRFSDIRANFLVLADCIIPQLCQGKHGR